MMLAVALLHRCINTISFRQDDRDLHGHVLQIPAGYLVPLGLRSALKQITDVNVHAVFRQLDAIVPGQYTVVMEL